MPTDDELFAIKERAAEQLMAIPSVTAVGIGGRVRDGRPTGEVVLKVFVERKLPTDQVPSGELVPAEFEGIPTDISELPPSGSLVQSGKPALPHSSMDDRRQRPLVGGCQMQPDLAGAGLGTLGCLVVNTSDPTKFYALTNWHVLQDSEPTVVGTTRAGQPTRKDSSTKCCSHIIGKVAGGGVSALRDAGLVELDPGMQWSADILEIGAVSGRHSITPAEAATHTYPVRKRGARSQLTGGTVESIGTSWTVAGVLHTNLVVVVPNPDPGQPAGTQLFFVQKGDSGSALVNSANEVVGLIFSEGSGSEVGKGAAIEIADVIGQFSAVEHLSVEIAVAVMPGVVNTVPGAAMVEMPPELAPVLVPGPATEEEPEPVRVPVVAGSALVAPPTPALARLSRDLDRSERGRALISLWLEHQDELLGLVNDNRRMTVAWHRSGASALFQLLTRMLVAPETRLPRTMHGQPLAGVLDRLTGIVDGVASVGLRRDLSLLTDGLPDLGGLDYDGLICALEAD